MGARVPGRTVRWPLGRLPWVPGAPPRGGVRGLNYKAHFRPLPVTSGHFHLLIIPIRIGIGIDFDIDFGWIWRPKGVPKGAQNAPQNGSNSKTNINITYEGFQVPLGCVLGPSSVVLGSILGSKIIKFRWFYQVSVNIVFLT